MITEQLEDDDKQMLQTTPTAERSEISQRQSDQKRKKPSSRTLTFITKVIIDDNCENYVEDDGGNVYNNGDFVLKNNTLSTSHDISKDLQGDMTEKGTGAISVTRLIVKNSSATSKVDEEPNGGNKFEIQSSPRKNLVGISRESFRVGNGINLESPKMVPEGYKCVSPRRSCGTKVRKATNSKNVNVGKESRHSEIQSIDHSGNDLSCVIQQALTLSGRETDTLTTERPHNSHQVHKAAEGSEELVSKVEFKSRKNINNNNSRVVDGFGSNRDGRPLSPTTSQRSKLSLRGGKSVMTNSNGPATRSPYGTCSSVASKSNNGKKLHMSASDVLNNARKRNKRKVNSRKNDSVNVQPCIEKDGTSITRFTCENEEDVITVPSTSMAPFTCENEEDVITMPSTDDSSEEKDLLSPLKCNIASNEVELESTAVFKDSMVYSIVQKTTMNNIRARMNGRSLSSETKRDQNNTNYTVTPPEVLIDNESSENHSQIKDAAFIEDDELIRDSIASSGSEAENVVEENDDSHYDKAPGLVTEEFSTSQSELSVSSKSKKSTGLSFKPQMSKKGSSGTFPSPYNSTTSGSPHRRSTLSHDGANKQKTISSTTVLPNNTNKTALPLSVGREKERRLATTSTNSPNPTDAETRRNLDKRTARLQYSSEFKREICNIRDALSLSSQYNNEERLRDDEYDNVYERGGASDSGVAVFVRKRPLFNYEIDRHDFDVVSVVNRVASAKETGSVLLHQCMMHADMRRKMLKDVSFPCTAVFDEHSSNSTIYNVVADPLVRSVASGGVSTLLMYGQTGSGKTYTMTSIEEQAATGLFAAIEAGMQNCDTDASQPTVKVCFIELAGKACRDLLAHRSAGASAPVKIVDSEDGSVHVLNAIHKVASTAADLMDVINMGKRRRATEATDANGVSSRSHAICQIQIIMNRVDNDSASLQKEKRGRSQERGLLTLIDCAGSERRNDSMYHSSERQKESAEINASLWALKECIRARSRLFSGNTNTNPLLSTDSSTKQPNNAAESCGEQTVHVPYRSSNLTRILREAFEREGAKLCVIATVSPNATDTEHTIETLKTVANIGGIENSIVEGTARELEQNGSKSLAVPPKAWNNKKLRSWMTKKGVSPEKVPTEMDGKAMMRLTNRQISTTFFNGDNSKGISLFNSLRLESERVCKLHRKERAGRKSVGRGMSL